MSSFFTDRLPRLSRLATGLALALGLSVLFSTTQALAGDGDRGDVDRGENPVVGSLPCKVDPGLELMFWEGLGEQDPHKGPAMAPPTLGLCSDDIRGNVLNADGIPYGRLNDRWDWRALGLQKAGWASFPSALIASGDVSGWVWAPNGYHGGELVMISSFGNGRAAVGMNALELPMADLVALTGSAASVTTFRLKPPAGSSLPVITMRVTIAGPVTTISYL